MRSQIYDPPRKEGASDVTRRACVYLNRHWAGNCKIADNVKFEAGVEGFAFTATEFASQADPLLGTTCKPELGEIVVLNSV